MWNRRSWVGLYIPNYRRRDWSNWNGAVVRNYWRDDVDFDDRRADLHSWCICHRFLKIQYDWNHHHTFIPMLSFQSVLIFQSCLAVTFGIRIRIMSDDDLRFVYIRKCLDARMKLKGRWCYEEASRSNYWWPGRIFVDEQFIVDEWRSWATLSRAVYSTIDLKISSDDWSDLYTDDGLMTILLAALFLSADEHVLLFLWMNNLIENLTW